jgi:phosphate transport system permease protein
MQWSGMSSFPATDSTGGPQGAMPSGEREPVQGELLALAANRGRNRSVAARKRTERVIRGSLFLCATLSVITTFTIIVILIRETLGFFAMPEVSLTDFLFGTEWAPLLGAEKHFGILPLVSGTLLVSAVAALFALPLGLITAIYLSEYAPAKVRSVLKPVLEILAGVPTVVYGFFALSVITPGLKWFHEGFESFNAASAGLAVGIMILPIVCSLSEDALRAVPNSLRDGARALGSTRFDVAVRVVVPAALSGIVAAFLLAITRAVGETMIVALAAGGRPHLTIDPTQETQTMTAYMVQIFLGDAPAGGVEYKSSYAVAFVLFAVTLGFTLIGNAVLRRFREEYD